MAPDQATDYDSLPEDLRDAISEAIRMLEAEDWLAFLQTHAHPGELGQVLAGRTMERLVDSFAKGKATGLLATLRRLEDGEAVISRDDERVTFTFDSTIDKVHFERAAGAWRLLNE